MHCRLRLYEGRNRDLSSPLNTWPRSRWNDSMILASLSLQAVYFSTIAVPIQLRQCNDRITKSEATGLYRPTVRRLLSASDGLAFWRGWGGRLAWQWKARQRRHSLPPRSPLRHLRGCRAPFLHSPPPPTNPVVSGLLCASPTGYSSA